MGEMKLQHSTSEIQRSAKAQATSRVSSELPLLRQAADQMLAVWIFIGILVLEFGIWSLVLAPHSPFRIS